MGRRPDPVKMQLRQEAAKLEREGLKPNEIAARMGQDASKVRYWLRQERGSRTSYKSAVLKLLSQGETDLHEIAIKVGCGYENVRKIEREWRGFLKRPHRSGPEMVAEFVSDPAAGKDAAYTLTKSFSGALVSECNRANNEDPKGSRGLLDLAAFQLRHIRSKLRDPKKIQALTCNQVQIAAIEAARGRMLAENQADLETALSHLLAARDLRNDGCPPCEADLLRREAVILYDMKRFGDCFARLDSAEDLYRRIGDSGHDPFRNGLGSCALARVLANCYAGESATAIRIADKALAGSVGAIVQPLAFAFRFNRTLALLGVPEQRKEAKLAAAGLLSEVPETATINRLHVVYMAGRAALLNGDREEALNHFEDAYLYAEELHVGGAISALESDIAKLTGSPDNFRERIERLRDGKQEGFPSWLKSIAATLDRASEMALTDFSSAVALLRREADFLPILA